MSNKDQLDLSDLGAALPAAAAALSAEDRAGLVNALKNKLQNLAGQHSDVLETLPPKIRKRVDVLRELQHRYGLEVSSSIFVRLLLFVALSAEDRAGLVNALKNKLQNLAGQHSDVLETLPPKIRKRVDVLRELQSQHDELEAKFFEERAALEAKYQKLYGPLYDKRFEIVNGVVEVEGVTSEATMDLEDDKSTETEKGVPDFWVNAMKHNEVLAEEISERDEEALKYLRDIKWCRIDNPKGFKLEFFFDTNPFFKNLVLTKTYHMIDDDEPILEKAIGTEIEWYPGKCLTQKILKKKPKKGSKYAKPITKTEKCESFFNFFSPPEVPEDDDDIDEDTAEELQNQMEQDYDIGKVSRVSVRQNASNSSRGIRLQTSSPSGNTVGYVVLRF
ncbi:hypothetical protein TEA_016740 [Camellia sinensis var. sinensis]|uniref:Nucleosome assembly protein 1 n=1 Tax=Camellia sinensis var. sinensis TaxID=542762 RepID=A0A4S4ECP3_CAMSN|nr:hypothetical protein TEA_016740 [Camellia sinensis var. sinensis]